MLENCYLTAWRLLWALKRTNNHRYNDQERGWVGHRQSKGRHNNQRGLGLGFWPSSREYLPIHLTLFLKRSIPLVYLIIKIRIRVIIKKLSEIKLIRATNYCQHALCFVPFTVSLAGGYFSWK